jgi:hypothetical protein
LLRQLSGEITLEMDAPIQPTPVWKVILRVNDPNLLQDTLSKLMTMIPTHPEQFTDRGVTYHTLQIPSPQKASKISYAFKDGYLIIAADRETVAQAIRLHSTGESLAKSDKFLAAMPPGHSATASGLFYQDPSTMMAQRLQQVQPEMAAFLSKLTTEGTPTATFVYADESSIREASAHGGMDLGAVLVGAAIAIPNLLHPKIAASDDTAASTVRSINAAELAYSNTHSGGKDYASDLATLSGEPVGTSAISSSRTGLINVSCTTGSWCTKSGFRFGLVARCMQQLCYDYAVTATPQATSNESKNFCSTSDQVVRVRIGPPLVSPVSVSQCRTWSPLH